MTDNLTKNQRSRCMSNIKSKWTSQERRVHNYLKRNNVKHRMHPKLEGNPDLILTEQKTAVFLHGCFWHKCPKCFKEPKSNRKYWLPKLENNVKRDRSNTRLLKKKGWGVITLWGHDLKNHVSISKKLKL